MPYKNVDYQYWERYKNNKTPQNRSALLKRFAPLIQSRVNRWVGPVPRDILTNEAKLLAIKAFDSYDPKRGVALATHVTNGLAPLSRVVYSHQNTSRLPENLVIKTHSYQAAIDNFSTLHGREPTTDELHEELGWSKKEIDRIAKYLRKDLVESVGNVQGSFYDDSEDKDDDALAAIYFDLLPDEKKLFEYVTGFNNTPVLRNSEIMKKLGISQSQLSYKKTLLMRKIKGYLERLRF